ncbi:MAG: signal recognition particle-docking protein FtsY [Spirochaetes bacterium GWB1_66_5]|nr:MAG: signal recognition particle-docking protein FtsY [Spirochaetes bacterium GWB1_66_5]
MKGFGARLRELFGRPARDEQFFAELGDILLEADLGPAATDRLLEELRKQVGSAQDRDSFLAALKGLLAASLRFEALDLVPGSPNLLLVLGVNGVGKTTTIAKLAAWYRRRGSQVLLAAGDTFRAAAIDQLALWGERLEVPVVRQAPGADPGAVIFDAIASARARGADLVLADTAGRLHNKTQLMKELGKIDKIIRARLEPRAAYRKVLVIDATTGQNAVRQAEAFQQAVGVDSVILAKYDSTGKGGAVVSLCRDLGLPISFVGTGEKLEDLELFDAGRFLDALVARE